MSELPDPQNYPYPTFKIPLPDGRVSEYRRTKKHHIRLPITVWVWEWTGVAVRSPSKKTYLDPNKSSLQEFSYYKPPWSF